MAALESVLVALIVAGCAIFSGWRLISVRLRLQALDLLARLPLVMGGRLATRLRRKTLAGLSGGCSACQQATHTVNGAVQFSNRRSGAPRR